MTAGAPAVGGRPPAPPRDGPSRLATALLILPAGLWYLFLLVLPIAIVLLFSVGDRGDTGGYAGGFTFDNYEGAFRNASPFVTSLYLSIAGTLLCLLHRPAARVFHRDPRRQAQDAA